MSFYQCNILKLPTFNAVLVIYLRVVHNTVKSIIGCFRLTFPTFKKLFHYKDLEFSFLFTVLFAVLML